jgi:peptidoglycan/LPS O-acetylase OafA/YrhL
VPVTYLIAAIGYRWIEIPGQALGKALTRKRAMAAA